MENSKSEVCNCGVPQYLHGTSCGWDNASVIIQNGETTIVSNVTGEEKKERYLQSTKHSPASDCIAVGFAMPTDKQLIDIAILFNDGKLEQEKLADMVAMCQFVLDRLKENNDVTIASSKEK